MRISDWSSDVCSSDLAHVAAGAETMVAGERDGCASHGIYRLLVCAHTIRSGKVVLDAEPRIAASAPGLVRVDAGGGFAQLAFERGRPLLAEKARAGGIAALAINRCVHFAALWPEVEALAEDGLVAFACTPRSEEHTSELQLLMRKSYSVNF